jgi:hypothetical protein
MRPRWTRHVEEEERKEDEWMCERLKGLPFIYLDGHVVGCATYSLSQNSRVIVSHNCCPCSFVIITILVESS